MKTKAAIRHFGSKSRIAHILGISPQAVHRWGDTVPFDRQPRLMIASAGLLKMQSRRPKRKVSARAKG